MTEPSSFDIGEEETEEEITIVPEDEDMTRDGYVGAEIVKVKDPSNAFSGWSVRPSG